MPLLKLTHVLIIFLLIGRGHNLQAQADSVQIDSLLSFHFRVDSVTTGKLNKRMKLGPQLPRFSMFSAQADSKWDFCKHFATKKINCNSATDTMAYAEFDFLESHHTIVPVTGHRPAVVHLNKKSKVLILHKYSIMTGDPLRRLFSIIKLTKSGMILRDVSYPELNRVYYFSSP